MNGSTWSSSSGETIDTKDWLWWTKPKPYLEIHQPEPKHPLCEVIPVADMGWHWFGVFDHAPGGAERAQSRRRQRQPVPRFPDRSKAAGG